MDHDFSITALAESAVPSVVELCREALDLPEDAAEAAEIVSCLWERPSGRQIVGFVATTGETVTGVAIGSIAQREPTRGHIDLIAVRPSARRRGIGQALVERTEAALGALGATKLVLVGNPPHYAWPGIDVRYTPAICLAGKLGYERHHLAWNMTADLSYDDSPALRPTKAAERRLAEQGVTIRAAEPEDIPALTAFAKGNFGGHWDVEVSDSIGRPGAGCHLAVRDGEVLGFAAYGSSRPSWFGPMGTAPALEGQGIGGVLLRRCLRDQRQLGLTQSQIGWVGPARFYSGSAGARIERVFFLFQKTQ